MMRKFIIIVSIIVCIVVSIGWQQYDKSIFGRTLFFSLEASDVPVTIIKHASQSDDLLQIKTNQRTDLLEIEADGTLKFSGTATVFDDLRVPVQSVKVGGAAPTWAQIKDNGSGSTGVFAYLFATGADDEVHFSVQLPHSYKVGSDITPHVHWSPVDANAGGVTWGLEYTWANINGTFGDTTLITADDATDSTADKHHIAAFSAVDGTDGSISSMLICRLYRDVSDANDTYGSDAALLEIDFHFEIDTIGSRTATSK